MELLKNFFFIFLENTLAKEQSKSRRIKEGLVKIKHIYLK